MPSPFPGMNPYLERPGVWSDFQGGFVYRLQAQLVRQTPSRLRVWVRPRVCLRGQPGEERARYIDILDLDAERVVTSLEVPSLPNKFAGDDHDQYRAKQTRLHQARANFLQVDLLRAGPRLVPELPTCDYYAMVAYGSDVQDAAVWPILIREPLPTIPVPLRPGDPVPHLDLKAALDAVSDDAGYHWHIYNHLPDPPLSAEDAAWAAGFIPRPVL